MQRKPVESSQIVSIGYDAGARKLEIEFPGRNGESGPVYEYENVPSEVHDGFYEIDPETKKPRSIGRYFGQTIKSNPKLYPYKKLDAKR